MKNRKLRLVANISGFETVIAEVAIKNFASEIDVKDWTDLVCPQCGTKPKWTGGYICPNDQTTFNHWSKLKRVIKGTLTALTTPRLIAEGEVAVAKLSWLTQEEFAHDYTDATRKEDGEKGVVLTEDKYASLLFKLLVAVEELGYVIITKWNDTNEEVIGLLTTSASGRILIREIIPSNLIKVKQTLFIDRKAITPEEVAEAKAFVQHFIPKATPETFQVKDYRAKWKQGQVAVAEPEEQTQKVLDIHEILKQHKIEVQVPPAKKKAKKP